MPASSRSLPRSGFGTSAVFLTAVSTILGAILFLRFGYAVANVGFVGTLFIIILGHLVTVPTAMAIAEIATNQRVEGGGAYFILSRSFGLVTGAAIGIALYFSQAISVAFYLIAFAEAFDPVFAIVNEHFGLALADNRIVSFPATVLMTILLTRRGASFGLRALYVVVATLFASLLLFFLGGLEERDRSFQPLLTTVENPDAFFLVFAICFPAFTGMAAGVGLSGDLKNPKRAIPLGTLSATLVGMLVYILVAWKLAVSASPELLASDQLIMSRIALWGPIIPIGLAAATLSSALGSFLVAPRTLQALAADRVLPSAGLNRWLAQSAQGSGEPVNAALVSAAIAVGFVLMGDIDFVAQIISMFFMVTYGSICLVSFLEHFAADPSYRPGFRSRWYVSLFGAVMCLWISFQISELYAALALGVMIVLYLGISRANRDRRGLTNMFQGAIFQISRQLQVFLQKSRKEEKDSWRPSVVCISSVSFERLAAFDLLRWISHRYGFGTYLHYINGYLSRSTARQAEETLRRLVHIADVSDSNVFVDTMVSPSYTSAIAQLIQLPGISGKENNMVLFEYSKKESRDLEAILDNYQLVASLGFDVCILGSSDRGFGYQRQIHIWIMPADYENASLMILLAYILLGHPDWKGAEIRIFSVLPEEEHDQREEELHGLIRSGRIPISEKNIELIPDRGDLDRRTLVGERSKMADLVILGFRGEAVRRRKAELFTGYDELGNVLFVNTTKEIDLVGDAEEEQEPVAEEEAVEEEGESEVPREAPVQP